MRCENEATMRTRCKALEPRDKDRLEYGVRVRMCKGSE